MRVSFASSSIHPSNHPFTFVYVKGYCVNDDDDDDDRSTTFNCNNYYKRQENKFYQVYVYKTGWGFVCEKIEQFITSE